MQIVTFFVEGVAAMELSAGSVIECVAEVRSLRPGTLSAESLPRGVL